MSKEFNEWMAYIGNVYYAQNELMEKAFEKFSFGMILSIKSLVSKLNLFCAMSNNDIYISSGNNLSACSIRTNVIYEQTDGSGITIEDNVGISKNLVVTGTSCFVGTATFKKKEFIK